MVACMSHLVSLGMLLPLIRKQITWIEFLYLEKSCPLLMSNTRFMEPLMVPNDEPKSVNIDKISTALHVYYLNLIVNYLNTVQIAQIQAYNFECTPCSDAISGPINRVFDIKSGYDFCRYRNSVQVIYFQINGRYHYPSQSMHFWSIRTLNRLVAATELHKRRAARYC